MRLHGKKLQNATKAVIEWPNSLRQRFEPISMSEMGGGTGSNPVAAVCYLLSFRKFQLVAH